MKLLKVSGLNSIASMVRIITQLAVTKVIVLSMGATGLVTVGQIQNFISILSTGSTLGTFSGVVKQTAENEDSVHFIWSTALTMSGVIATIGLMASSFWSHDLAKFLFDDRSKAYLVVLCAFANLFVVLQALIFHALNGLRHYKLYIVCSILNSIIGLMMVIAAAAIGGGPLILLVMCFSQAIQIAGATIAFMRTPEMTVVKFFQGLNTAALKTLLPFIAIGISTAGVLPITQLLVRSHLISSFGLAEAGHWEAAMKISTIYVSLASTVLGLYLIPEFAKSKDKFELYHTLIHTLGVVFLLSLCGAVAQFLLRDWIITLIFSKDFIEASELLVLQLAGDGARILMMVLLFVATSKADSWAVVFVNLVFGVIFYAAMLIWTAAAGGSIASASAAYTLANVVALLFAFIVVSRMFLGRKA